MRASLFMTFSMRGFRTALDAPIAVGLRVPAPPPPEPAADASGALASNTGNVEVTATFFATKVLIVSFTGSLLISSVRRLCETAAPGQLCGCLFGTNSESGKLPACVVQVESCRAAGTTEPPGRSHRRSAAHRKGQVRVRADQTAQSRGAR